ncbi:MAG TPA: glutamate racemase [Bacteroidia bacterium]|nr:glutamate racemase [Bacteroidia bacterium]
MVRKNIKNQANRPIGIFDSGIGGLTVANAIHEVLPNEQLIYFGDTAHMPYGDKSPDSIKYYAIRISQFLLEHDCKIIVIACNTASAIAYEVVKDFVGEKALVVNVVDPVVKEVTQKKIKSVGVIGTKGTIKSDIYAKKIYLLNKNIEVKSLATPLLASMIEEGFFNNKISRTIINSYLSRPRLKKIDALILACTHYPLIKKEIQEYYEKNILIIDSAKVVANYVYDLLKKEKLLNTTKNLKQHFYVSDYTNSFEKSTKYFFKNKIHLEKISLWK